MFFFYLNINLSTNYGQNSLLLLCFNFEYYFSHLKLYTDDITKFSIFFFYVMIHLPLRWRT